MSLVEKALKKLQEQNSPKPLAAVHAPHADHGDNTIPTDSAWRARDVVHEPPKRVVHIDMNALRAAGLLPPQDQDRGISAQYRQIKRPLIDNAMGRGTARLAAGHLIMLASAMSGEGKTFTSINLALSMALEKDIRVVLIDADVAKPHISKLLGLESTPGLLDALRDTRIDVESLILPTDVPGLSVLPAGTHSSEATELLASNRMQEIAGRIGAEDSNRIALFDSPPLLLTTESHALAQAMGQIVMVVFTGVTLQQSVMDALERLPPGKHVGLVLNQSSDAAPQSYYYYGYGRAVAGEAASPSGQPSRE